MIDATAALADQLRRQINANVEATKVILRVKKYRRPSPETLCWDAELDLDDELSLLVSACVRR